MFVCVSLENIAFVGVAGVVVSSKVFLGYKQSLTHSDFFYSREILDYKYGIRNQIKLFLNNHKYF